MLESNNYYTLSEIVFEKIEDLIITHRYECWFIENEVLLVK